MQQFQVLATMNQALLKTKKNSIAINHSTYNSLDTDKLKPVLRSCPSNSDVNSSLSQASRPETLLTDNQSLIYDQASISDVIPDYPLTESQVIYPDIFASSYCLCIFIFHKKNS